jgi:hypothetical protein
LSKQYISESAPHLGIPPDAANWLVMVWEAFQTLDDCVDAGESAALPTRKDLNALIWNSLVAMPSNPFFLKHQVVLNTAMGTQILKWQASDYAERHGQADARSFVWRAGYYDLVLLVVQLCNPPAAAHRLAPVVMAMYGESFEDYQEEFPCQK